MAHYMLEVSYTPESWKSQIDSRANVVERITPALEACGAKLDRIFYAFGEVDVIAIADFKRAEDAAAFSLAVGSSGALRLCRMTQLLTVEQGMESMRTADDLRRVYSPPTSVSITDKAVPAQR
jgi:uncharacterized protein with GYD domain